MEIKTITCNIKEYRENTNDRFRVHINEKKHFDILEVNIVRLKTGEKQTFQFSSNELPDKDSIHFTTRVENGKFIVEWKAM